VTELPGQITASRDGPFRSASAPAGGSTGKFRTYTATDLIKLRGLFAADLIIAQHQVAQDHPKTGFRGEHADEKHVLTDCPAADT
jgi:hypothetical protein